MKKILIAAMATACVTVMSYGQGQVNFDNRTGNNGAGAPVYDVDGVTPVGFSVSSAVGLDFFAQLYAAGGTGIASSSLIAVGTPVNFTSWNNSFPSGAGMVNYPLSGVNSIGQPVNATVNIASVTPAGGPATIQMRVWWAGVGGTTYTSFDTYATAAAADVNARWGWSSIVNLASTGNQNAQPAILPVDLPGLQSFQLNSLGAVVPEPATLALAGLGAASLLRFRRRK